MDGNLRILFVSVLAIATVPAGCTKTEIREVEKIVEVEVPVEIPVPADELTLEDVEWARTNVAAPGTFAQNPEDFGMFYRWNNTVGWSTTDPLVPHDGTSEWSDSDMNNLNEIPEWNPANDPCPEGWRTPTNSDLATLYATTDSEWTTLNGVNGYRFSNAEIDIFFPATGYRTNAGSLYSQGEFGYYWSSTPDQYSPRNCFHMLFGPTGVYPFYTTYFAAGITVRCVR
jgi:uncharacterized protein (TIGR02145 family)